MKMKQKKQNELERLKTEQALITSKGLTKEILYKQFIDKWDGELPKVASDAGALFDVGSFLGTTDVTNAETAGPAEDSE